MASALKRNNGGAALNSAVAYRDLFAKQVDMRALQNAMSDQWVSDSILPVQRNALTGDYDFAVPQVVGNALSAVPPAVRTFVGTVAGNKAEITEQDFSESELAILEEAVAKAEREGRTYIGYGDYGERDPWSSGSSGAWDALTDAAKSMAFTIGMANFRRDEDGSIVIEDAYDFNASRPQVDEALEGSNPVELVARGFAQNGVVGAGNVIGNLVAPEGEGRKIAIRLPSRKQP